jgi:hypothetical protein
VNVPTAVACCTHPITIVEVAVAHRKVVGFVLTIRVFTVRLGGIAIVVGDSRRRSEIYA